MNGEAYLEKKSYRLDFGAGKIYGGGGFSFCLPSDDLLVEAVVDSLVVNSARKLLRVSHAHGDDLFVDFGGEQLSDEVLFEGFFFGVLVKELENLQGTDVNFCLLEINLGGDGGVSKIG